MYVLLTDDRRVTPRGTHRSFPAPFGIGAISHFNQSDGTKLWVKQKLNSLCNIHIIEPCFSTSIGIPSNPTALFTFRLLFNGLFNFIIRNIIIYQNITVLSISFHCNRVYTAGIIKIYIIVIYIQFRII